MRMPNDEHNASDATPMQSDPGAGGDEDEREQTPVQEREFGLVAAEEGVDDVAHQHTSHA